MNFKNGSCESLAFLFLLQWLLGDITNLVGAVLSGQLATQIYTAIYFCSVDAVMISQYAYYRFKEKREEQRALKSLYAVLAISLLSVSGFTFLAPAADPLQNNGVVSTGRSLLTINSFTDAKSITGYVLGVISALLYLCSRIPQIVKNFKRKSVGGLSFFMFLMAVMGNTTYALSVLMYSVDGDFIIDKLPWLCGSMGTLVFDFTIFSQFVLYGKNGSGSAEHHHDAEHDDHDDTHHHHHNSKDTTGLIGGAPKKQIQRANSPLLLPISKRDLSK